MVPLALWFIQGPKAPKTCAKKMVTHNDDDGAVSEDGSCSKPAKHVTPSKMVQRARKQHQEKAYSFTESARAAERAEEKTQIEACVKAGDLPGAEARLARLAEKGNADAICYNMLISLCAKLGEPKKADQWMRRMLQAGVRPDVASFNSNIDACARSGDIEGAEQWLTKMSTAGLGANTVSYNTVINACAKAGNIPRAQWWMQQLCEAGTPDVVSYTSLINAFAQKGDAYGAEKWLIHMVQSGIEANVVSFSTVITACARVGDKAAAA